MAERRIEGNFSQGWGTAAFIVLLVVLCFVAAFTINRRTFEPPNNQMPRHPAEAPRTTSP